MLLLSVAPALLRHLYTIVFSLIMVRANMLPTLRVGAVEVAAAAADEAPFRGVVAEDDGMR